MATTRFSFTFATADPSPFGPFPRWIVGQEPTLVDALDDARMTASRGDWLHFVLARVRARLGGTSLDFLFQGPSEPAPETDESAFLLTAIAPEGLPAAIALADAWRAAIDAEPGILASACERDVAFIREQLASAKQREGFAPIDEDGDEPTYLPRFPRRPARRPASRGSERRDDDPRAPGLIVPLTGRPLSFLPGARSAGCGKAP